MNESPVSSLMTRNVLTVHPDTPFQSVVRALLERGVDAAPVVDRGRLLGVVSTSDLTAHEEEPASMARILLGGREERRHARKCRGRTAAELMTAPAVTTGPSASVCDALRSMGRHHVGRLVVVEGDPERVVGMLTRSDVLRVFLREDEVLAADARAALTSTLTCDSDVEVSVRYGVVHLLGWVERSSAGWAAVAAVRAVPGVVDVEDTLTYRIDDALTEQLALHGPMA